MSTARLVCLSLLLSLAAAPVHADQLYEVWEDSGAIWGREIATGYVWQTSVTPNAHSPDVDGPMAVWIADWAYTADVVLYDMTRRYDMDGGPVQNWGVAVDPAVQSDPQITYIGAYPYEVFYVIWRQDNSLWGRRSGKSAGIIYYNLVPDYSGPYTLEGRTLAWEGGSMELSVERLPAPVPEPSALVLLLVATLCLLWHRATVR